MGYSRQLKEEHKRKISDGVKRAWARVPVDKEGKLMLDVNFDLENNEINKCYFNGKEIKK